jgi:hypothetical protein
MLLAIAGSQWETSWFEVEFQTQMSTKIPLESSHQGLPIDVIQIWWFLCQIIQLYLLKVQNIACSDSFWLCPD